MAKHNVDALTLRKGYAQINNITPNLGFVYNFLWSKTSATRMQEKDIGPDPYI